MRADTIRTSDKFAAELGEQGIVLDYRYEFPEYACTGRLEGSESFTSTVLAPE